MNKAPAFQFYPGDWLSSSEIALMTPAEEGAYIRLLCYDWAKDGIPDDDEKLARLSRLAEGWFNGGSTVVKAQFSQHPTKAGYLTNSRLQIEREKQRLWREKSKKGAQNSLKARKLKPRSKGGSRVVQPGLNSSSSSSSSDNKERERENAHANQPAAEIPTLEEIKTYGDMHAITPESCKAFWDHYQGNNLWLNQHGRPINWQVKLQTWAANDRQTTQPGGQPRNGKATRSDLTPSTRLVALQNQEKALTEQMRQHRAKHYAEEPVCKWDPGALDEYKRLKAERDKTRRMISETLNPDDPNQA